MNEDNDVEAKWVRVQASLDELADTLAIRLRTVILRIGEGDTIGAIRFLEGIIEGVEVFAGATDADEADEAGD